MEKTTINFIPNFPFLKCLKYDTLSLRSNTEINEITKNRLKY